MLFQEKGFKNIISFELIYHTATTLDNFCMLQIDLLLPFLDVTGRSGTSKFKRSN